MLVTDSSTVTFMAVVGVMVHLCHLPQDQALQGGSPVPQWDRCWGRGCDFGSPAYCCQSMAIWHLTFLQPPLSHCSPSQAKLWLLCYVLLYLPFQKKKTKPRYWES